MNFDSKMEKNSGLYKDNIDHHLPPRRACSKSNPNLNSFSGSVQFNFCTEEDPKNCQISVLIYTSYCVNALFKCVVLFIDGSSETTSQNVLFWLANYVPTTYLT